MYTRCPECGTEHRISVTQLKAGGGLLTCAHCLAEYDAAPALATTRRGLTSNINNSAPTSNLIPPKDHQFSRQTIKTADLPVTKNSVTGFGRAENVESEVADSPFSVTNALMYALGSLAFLIVLGLQIFAFESQKLSQNSFFRPLLNSVCKTLGCELQPYSAPNNIKIMDRTLNKIDDPKPGLDFGLLFSNKSGIEQAYPKIKLVLNDDYGQAVAQRIFDPSEYLPNWDEKKTMPNDIPVEIHLFVAKPQREVGGFSIDLL